MPERSDSKPNAEPQGIVALYTKALWGNFFVFFLLDVLFGFFVIIISYTIGLLAHRIAYQLVPITMRHINSATVVLSLIYLVSIVIVSLRRHVTFIKQETQMDRYAVTDSSDQETNSMESKKNNA